MDDTKTDTLTLTSDELAGIRIAMNKMPYAAGIVTGPFSIMGRNAITGESLINWLETLADRLKGAAEGNHRTAVRLEELERERATVRAYFGVKGD